MLTGCTFAFSLQEHNLRVREAGQGRAGAALAPLLGLFHGRIPPLSAPFLLSQLGREEVKIEKQQRVEGDPREQRFPRRPSLPGNAPDPELWKGRKKEEMPSLMVNLY